MELKWISEEVNVHINTYFGAWPNKIYIVATVLSFQEFLHESGRGKRSWGIRTEFRCVLAVVIVLTGDVVFAFFC